MSLGVGSEVAELLRNVFSEPIRLKGLSHMSAAGHGLRIQYVRTLTRERGLTSSPECSFVEHKSKIRHFVVDDQAHPDTIKFLEELAEDIPRLDTSLKQNLFSTTLMMKLSKI